MDEHGKKTDNQRVGATMTALEYTNASRRYQVTVSEMINPGGRVHLILSGRRSDIDHCQDLANKKGLATERVHPSELIVRGFGNYGGHSHATSSEVFGSRLQR
jgi:hypothetical protein